MHAASLQGSYAGSRQVCQGQQVPAGNTCWGLLSVIWLPQVCTAALQPKHARCEAVPRTDVGNAGLWQSNPTRLLYRLESRPAAPAGNPCWDLPSAVLLVQLCATALQLMHAHCVFSEGSTVTIAVPTRPLLLPLHLAACAQGCCAALESVLWTALSGRSCRQGRAVCSALSRSALQLCGLCG